ncbi:MAG: NACHT domain-containing protein [Ktedonobacteraceae bacterium]|nr:NACHT domain-containing protein [Ktedonobacteraceae bacterium]
MKEQTYPKKKGKPNQKLKQERELRFWTLEEVATRISRLPDFGPGEPDPRTVARWERGISFPSPRYRHALCDVFDLDAQELGLLPCSIEQESMPPPIPGQQQETAGQTRSAQVGEADQRPALFSSIDCSANGQAIGSLNSLAKLSPSLVADLPTSVAQLGPAPMSQQNRQRMVRKVRTFWISGVLEQSLHGAPLIALGLQERADAVANPWHVYQPKQIAQPLPPGTDLSQVYDAINGELLILGEPGLGKTTLLLELARNLLDRADRDETHPIPVVFNLSSWAQKQCSLSDWLEEELHSKYQVPRKLAQFWIQTEQILPLLDGLDEVRPTCRSACIETINAYRQEHGFLPLVVCCRQDEYFAQPARLLLSRAVVVQPLTSEQVEAYLASAGEQLAALEQALHADPALRDLASNPLMLSMLALTYQGKTVDAFPQPLSLQARRHQVFAVYVRHMLLTRRSNQSCYTAAQTLRYLAWLARQLVRQQQTEFYIESMQPNWLLEPRAFRWYCRLFIGLLVGVLAGLTAMLADVPLYEVVHAQLFALLTHTAVTASQCAYGLPVFGTRAQLLAFFLPFSIVGLTYGLGFGLLGGSIGGLFGHRDTRMKSIETGFWSAIPIQRRVITSLLGLSFGLIFVLINLLWVPCPLSSSVYNQVVEELSYGLTAVLIGGLAGTLVGGRETQIQPVEALVWSAVPIRRRVTISLLGGFLGMLVGGTVGLGYEVYLNFALWQMHLLTSGFIGGLAGAAIGWWLGGLSRRLLEDRTHIRPNEGIRLSARNGVLIGFPIGLAFTGLSLALSFWLIPTDLASGLLWSVPLGLIATLILFLLNGGYACLQHMVLRVILTGKGYTPWNYAHFLDEASERLLLRKVGGGYVFIHHLLLEYLASLSTVQSVMEDSVVER